jgi:serine/threonine protein phosphatase 1
VLDLVVRHPVVTAAMGNHDLALVRAAQLDGGPRSAYWVEGYRTRYDHEETFQSYLGRCPRYEAWDKELLALREAMPPAHCEFLASLPWLVEAPGHLFLHNGLSPDLEQSAEEQIEALRQKRWDNSLTPRPGTETFARWQTDYPVWLGADKRIADRPLPAPGRVQVTGHKPVDRPDRDAVRIRLDTTGGRGGPLTACLLRTADAVPEFVSGDEDHHANPHVPAR